MYTDTQLEDDVRAALRRDSRIRHPELIAVSADEIGTVVLRGAVGSLPERRAVAHDARHVEGVFGVIDRLKVHLPVTDRRADDEIRAAALQRLIADTRIRSDWIDVKASHGWLTLKGHVTEAAQIAHAEEDVATLAGVVGVTNQIQTRPPVESPRPGSAAAKLPPLPPMGSR